MSHRHATYLGAIFANTERRKATVDEAVKKLRRHKHKFDAIVATGVSGVTFGAIVAARLGVQLVVVRKTKRNCHSTTTCEGLLDRGEVRYLFVDDLIASGDTAKRVMEEVGRQNPRAKCVGWYTYYYRDQTQLNPKSAWAWWSENYDNEYKQYFALDKPRR
jgi:orotate phosphoribosyltransferase-like protein